MGLWSPRLQATALGGHFRWKHNRSLSPSTLGDRKPIICPLECPEPYCCGWHCVLQDECLGLFPFFSSPPKVALLLNDPIKPWQLLTSYYLLSCPFLVYLTRWSRPRTWYCIFSIPMPGIEWCLLDIWQISNNSGHRQGTAMSTYLLLVRKTVSFYSQVFSEIQSVFSFLDELQPQKEWPDLDRQAPYT